jgi:hypothetical protein
LASWSRLHLFPLFLWFYWPADGAVEPSFVQHTFVPALRAADAVFHAVSTYGTELFFRVRYYLYIITTFRVFASTSTLRCGNCPKSHSKNHDPMSGKALSMIIAVNPMLNS